MLKNAIPDSLRQILVDLNFLGQIARDTKPCFSNKILISSDSWWGALRRMVMGESRQRVIMKVEQIINNTVDAIENKKYAEHLPLTINALNDANNGVLNLLYTYDADPDMKSRLSIQLKNIDIQLTQYRFMIKGYNDKSGDKTDKSEDKVVKKEEEKWDLSNISEPKKDLPKVSSGINLMDSSSLEFEGKDIRNKKLRSQN